MNKILASITDWIGEYKNTEVSLRASSENDPTNKKKKTNLDGLREDGRKSLRDALQDKDVQPMIYQDRIDLRKARQEKIKHDKQESKAIAKVDQLRSEFMDEYQTLEQRVMNLLVPIPAIQWHMLDMEVLGKSIYDHLPKLQKKFSQKLSQVIAKKFTAKEAEFKLKL